jgi:hypothetical protein
MTIPTRYISFLIRLWREGDPEFSEPAVNWSSEVEHIQSGRRWTFTTLEETLSFLHRQADGQEILDLVVDE